MKSNIALCTKILIVLLVATSAKANEQALQHQVERLIQRVDMLEQRLNTLEGEAQPAIEQSKAIAPMKNPGVATDLDNWARLRNGLDYEEVREILGEPVSVSKGVTELWFYSEKKSKGPYVKFLFSKLHQWSAPQ